MAFGSGVGPLTSVERRVVALGLGCAPLGDLFAPVAEADADATVAAALDAGVRFFDTAPHYGAGLSETRLGRGLRGVDRSTVSVATKVGRRVVDDAGADVAPGAVGRKTEPDLSYDGVFRSVESSLSRLGLDRIDVLYLHDPDDVDAALAGAIRALESLRSQGVVRAIGAGMVASRPLARLAAEAPLDVVMIAGRLTLLDREAVEELLPVAERHGVQVIAAGVFNSGILADPVDGAPYDYVEAPAQLLAAARELQRRCERRGVPLRSAAMRFPLRYPAVGGVVIGARNPAEVDQAVEDFFVEIPPELWDELDQPL